MGHFGCYSWNEGASAEASAERGAREEAMHRGGLRPGASLQTTNGQQVDFLTAAVKGMVGIAQRLPEGAIKQRLREFGATTHPELAHHDLAANSLDQL